MGYLPIRVWSSNAVAGLPFIPLALFLSVSRVICNPHRNHRRWVRLSMRSKWVWAAQRLICHGYCPPLFRATHPFPATVWTACGSELHPSMEISLPKVHALPGMALASDWLREETKGPASLPRNNTEELHLIHRAPQTISWDSEATTLVGSPAFLAPFLYRYISWKCS